jgi:hypothetical protein
VVPAAAFWMTELGSIGGAWASVGAQACNASASVSVSAASFIGFETTPCAPTSAPRTPAPSPANAFAVGTPLAQLLNCAERPISKLVEAKKERLYPLSAPVRCDDLNDCTADAGCDPQEGCNAPVPMPDETPCAGGVCRSGACELRTSVLPCTEQGIRNAVAAGGGSTPR